MMAANLYASFLPAAMSGSAPIFPLTAPVPTVTTVGVAGSTTYDYQVTALNSVGETLASAQVSISTGNATLSSANYNLITVLRVPGASSYNVYGRSGATLFKLGSIPGNFAIGTGFEDIGGALGTSSPPTTDLSANPVKMALLTASYSPKLTTDALYADVSASEVTGAGYTAGGVLLTGKSMTLTPAASWSQVWTASTAYPYGFIITPPSGLLYRCVVAGTSGAAAPNFPTVTGDVVTDGTAEWACLGGSVLVFTSAPAAWTGLTVTASYAVIYSDTGNFPLIVLETFQSSQSPVDQAFSVVPDANLGWFAFSPPS